MNLSRYLSFDGRASRLEFWLIAIGSSIVTPAILQVASSISGGVLPGIAVLVLLALVILAGFATQIRRWHDRNKSGYWIFIHLIPGFGSIWALIELGFMQGTAGSNRFGATDGTTTAQN